MPPVPAHGSHFPEIAHVLKTGRDSNSHPPPYRGGWGVCTGSSCRKEKKKNKIKDFLFLSFFLSSFSLAVFDVLSRETAQCSRAMMRCKAMFLRPLKLQRFINANVSHESNA
jgi:hypothetical protein